MTSEPLQQFHGIHELKSSNSWIVEDDADSAKAIQGILQSSGSTTRTFCSGKQLLDAISAKETPPDLICLDLSLPDISGLDLLPAIKAHTPHVPVVVVTGNTSLEIIERAVQLGVYDYLPKASDRTKFTTTFRRAIEHGRLTQRLESVGAERQISPQFGIYGVSPAIQALIEKIKQLAPVDVNVLVSGESGTGKELVARALHTASKRSKAPLVIINCAVLPRALIESELFGHEQGAFSGATAGHIGAFERAHGGTLFLDEIGELDLALQAKLLRVVEERRFLRLGGTKEIFSDFRLVVATNRDLLDQVSAGCFRKDLYYRFAVAEINVPALRLRSSDVGLLAHQFVQEFGAQLGKNVSLSPETAAVLAHYQWPGNVRELQNVIQCALIQCQEPALDPWHLPARVRNHSAPVPDGRETRKADRVKAAPILIQPLDKQEQDSIVESLRATQGRMSQAARLLGISRATLYRKLKKYGLSTRGQF
jgi:two-component system response regulator HydG